MRYQDYVPVLFLLQLKASSISIFNHWVFVLSELFTGNIISRTFPDFVKFKEISTTLKMNLLSKM